MTNTTKEDGLMHELGFFWDSYQSCWRNDGNKQYGRDYDDSVSSELAKQLVDFIKQYGIQVRNKAIDDVKKSGYGYDDGSGFVIKISYNELCGLKAKGKE